MPKLKRKSGNTWDKKRGRAKGGGQSSKAKGRLGCQAVQQLLLDWLPLTEADVFVKAGSQGGCDLHLSDAALKVFPYAIEVKNKETLNIWSALKQAADNAEGQTPVVFFKRAHAPLFVALKADDFLRLFDR